MPSLYVSDQLPKTSEEAIREFNERYLAAISAAPTTGWASRFLLPVGAPRTTFPIGLMSTKFQETKEQSGTFKTLAEKAFDLKVVEFDAGYEAKKIDLLTNTFSYRNWQKVPGRFALAEDRHVAKNIASLLENGTAVASPWDDLAFFDTSHQANPANASLGTFSNYNSVATDPAVVANIQAEMTAMRLVKDENGDKLGAEPDEIWLPTQKFQLVSDMLSKEYLANGESNPIRGKLKPVHIPELTDVNDWYLVDTKMFGMGIEPVVAANFRASEDLGLRTFDESSDFFKNTGHIKVSAHIWYGFQLVFPHAIRKIVGA